jgi:O-antigen/teichoic acid export membrane protein
MLATIVAVIVLLPIQVVLISELGVLGAGVSAFFSPIIILLARKYFYCGAINKRPDLVYTFK